MTQATRARLAAINKPGIAAVIALTLAGGVLRVVRLSHPPLLFDEAATYTRITGLFAELLEILRYDGFAPLHYELYWLMSRVFRMTPAMMRIVPALAGSLMIPAIYFLARQVVSRRVATLAAALTAASAWQFVYSRDAKMYMELWLAATVFIGGLLWWLRDRSRVAWLTWVTAGVLMNGVHATGLLVTTVGLIIALMPRKRLGVALLGLMLTCSGLAVHYTVFNRFFNRMETEGWRSGGLDWVGQRNRAMGRPMLMWDTAASWMLAYRSPRPPIEPPHRVIQPVVMVSTIVLAALIAGMMRWPARLRDDDPDDAPPAAKRGIVALLIWIVVPCAAFALIPLFTGRDVWNARYLGIVWPPLVVFAALLVLRLPHRHLRGGVIVLLIGANVVQCVLRITAESGVPVDQIAADVAKGDVAVIVAVKNDPTATSIGGNGGIFDFPGRYHLSIATGLHLQPKELRDGVFEEHFTLMTDVREIPPTAKKVIVWTDNDKAGDAVLASLEHDWKRVSEEQHRVRDAWCWRNMFRCRRTVLSRGGK